MLDGLLLSGENVEGTFKKIYFVSIYGYVCSYMCAEVPTEARRACQVPQNWIYR